MEIRPYDESEDQDRILELFRTEKDWECYLAANVIDKYLEALRTSLTYVCYVDHELVGYSRSIVDFDTYIYVCDLLVNRLYRGRSLGRDLMECILEDYPDHETYVMSDVDKYYEKLGYEREGSIFNVKRSKVQESLTS